eukprot:225313_1
MAYAKLLIILISTKLVLSRLDRKTDCCVTIVSARNVRDVDPFGSGDPYIQLSALTGNVPSEISRTQTKPMRNTIYYNEEFCGGGPNEVSKLNNIRYDSFIFKAYAEMTRQSQDQYIGETSPIPIAHEDCCDSSIREQQLVDSTGTMGVGFVKFKIQCDYNCGTKTMTNTLPPADDVKPCEYIPSANSDPQNKDKGGKKNKGDGRSNVQVKAIALFKSADSEIDGEVTVDSNGNVLINLDLPKLDTSDCSELEYAIYSRNDYDDLRSRRDCDENKLGVVFDPFEAGMCYDNNGSGDMYFECASGDLSGRCGTIKVDNSGSVDVECNVSEDSNDKEGGFCNARLTPESLYKRSIVFNCKGGTNSGVTTFCAGFEVTNDYKL